MWVATGFWPITPEARLLLARALSTAGAISVTLAVSMAVRSMADVYGATLSPALPVTSLTRTIASAMVLVTGGLIILNGLGSRSRRGSPPSGSAGWRWRSRSRNRSRISSPACLAGGADPHWRLHIKLDSGQQGYVTDFSWHVERVVEEVGRSVMREVAVGVPDFEPVRALPHFR